MTVATGAGGGGTDPSRFPGASAASVVTVVVPGMEEAIGTSSEAALVASRPRIAYLIRHEWGGAENCQERIGEECRGVWERWATALMEKLPDVSWTYGGFDPAEVTCTEGTEPSGERFCRCAVTLQCWVEYEVRHDSPGGPDCMKGVRPALTPEQWRTYAPLDRTLAHHAPALAHENAHGAAALALHGQPYGFTWDDYDELVDNANEVEIDYACPYELLSPEAKQQIDALRSIARRIAALLPPRDAHA